MDGRRATTEGYYEANAGSARTFGLTAALLSVTFAAWAQTPPGTPAAKPADVATPDAIINAVYASISGPAGSLATGPDSARC